MRDPANFRSSCSIEPPTSHFKEALSRRSGPRSQVGSVNLCEGRAAARLRGSGPTLDTDAEHRVLTSVRPKILRLGSGLLRCWHLNVIYLLTFDGSTAFSQLEKAGNRLDQPRNRIP